MNNGIDGQSEVKEPGMVPEGWKEKTLADITKKKISYGIVQAGPHVAGGIPYIKSSDLRGGIRPSELQCTSQEIHYNYRRSSVHPGDIVFSLRGNIGILAVVPSALEEANLTQGTARISVDDTQSNIFHFYQLSTCKVTNRVSALSKGSTFKEISLKDLREVKVLVPTLPEQKKIAEILSTWDHAIDATERLLDNSRQRKKALMQQLLTGKKRLPGFGGEWGAKKIGDFCILGAGQSSPQEDVYFDKNGYDFLRVSDIGASLGRFAPKSRDKVNDNAVVDKKLKKVPAGATVFTKSGASLLLNQRSQLREDTYIVSHLGFAHGGEVYSDDFIYYVFCLIDFGKIAAGTSLPALQLSVLQKIKITVPLELKEQQAIANVLSTADEEIASLICRLEALKQEKKALMQQLLTGKRRVNVDTEAA